MRYAVCGGVRCFDCVCACAWMRRVGVYSTGCVQYIVCAVCEQWCVLCVHCAYNVFIACTMCSVFPFVARCMARTQPARAMPPSHPLHLPASQLMNEDRKQMEAERERTAYQVRLS